MQACLGHQIDLAWSHHLQCSGSIAPCHLWCTPTTQWHHCSLHLKCWICLTNHQYHTYYKLISLIILLHDFHFLQHQSYRVIDILLCPVRHDFLLATTYGVVLHLSAWLFMTYGVMHCVFGNITTILNTTYDVVIVNTTSFTYTTSFNMLLRYTFTDHTSDNRTAFTHIYCFMRHVVQKYCPEWYCYNVTCLIEDPMNGFLTTAER